MRLMEHKPIKTGIVKSILIMANDTHFIFIQQLFKDTNIVAITIYIFVII